MRKFLITTLFCMFLMTSLVSSALIDNLISYWKLDDDLDTDVVLDANSNNNDGAVRNDQNDYTSEQSTATAKLVKAFDLDGANDYVVIADDISLTNTNFTFSIWVNADSVTDYQSIAGKGSASGQREWRLDLYYNSDANDGKLRFLLGKSDGAWGVTTYYSTSVLSTATWYNLVITYNGTTQVIYINGTEDSNNPYTGTLKDGNQELFIGNDGAAGKDFNGIFDEVGYWNRTWSSDEVSDYYNLGSPPSYPFEEAPENCWTEETWGIFIPNGCVYEILNGEVG